MNKVVKFRPEIILTLAWLATMMPTYLMAAGHLPDIWRGPEIDDTGSYLGWTHIFLQHHTYPVGDVSWQYPPAVALMFLLPVPLAHLTGVTYQLMFMRLMLAADLGVTVMLARLARRNGSWRGAAFWIVAVPLMGPLALGRFDLVACLFIVGALISRRPFVSGMLGGVGAALKLWPVAVLGGFKAGISRRLIGFAAGAVVVTAIPMALYSGGSSFAKYQSARGLEIESFAALPFLIKAHSDGDYHVTQRYGALEIVGPGVDSVTKVMLPLTAVCVAMLAWTVWRRRDRWHAAWTAEVPFVFVLIFVITSRVISAQYIVWSMALGAVCLAFSGTRQRPACVALLVAVLLNRLEYPIGFDDIIALHPAGIEVVGLRNVALLVTLVLAWRGLLQAERPGPDGVAATSRADDEAGPADVVTSGGETDGVVGGSMVVGGTVPPASEPSEASEVTV